MPKSTTKIYSDSLFVNGVKIWNYLPYNLKTPCKPHIFKACLKDYMNDNLKKKKREES